MVLIKEIVHEPPTQVDEANDEAPVNDDEEDNDEDFFVDEDYQQSDVEAENDEPVDHVEDDDSDNDYVVHPGEDDSDYGRSSILDSEDSTSEDEEEFDSQPTPRRRQANVKIKLPSFRQWNSQTDLLDPKFEVGLHFATVDEVREAVKEYAVRHGRVLSFIKNDKSRFRATCKPSSKQVIQCPFLFYASLKVTKEPIDQTFVLKKFNPKHTCVRQTKNKWATSSWLARRYEEYILNNPSIAIGQFQKKVLKDYRIDVSRWKVYLAKKKALRENHGAMEAQYAKLDEYAFELLERNPGSTVIIKSTGEVNARIFERIYICLVALKNGFKAGCRRVIGVDACHLKGRYKGQLLTAVGIDSNNGMFPVAYFKSSSLRSFVVDINRKTCSCGRWKLCGIPCEHAISALTSAGRDLIGEIDGWYKRDKYDATYAQHISPMPDSSQWTAITWAATTWKKRGLPPLVKAQPGRRENKRTLGRGECQKDDQKLKRIFIKITCTKCQALGHNRRTCPQVTEEDKEERRNATRNARNAERNAAAPEPPAAINSRTPKRRKRCNVAQNASTPNASVPNASTPNASEPPTPNAPQTSRCTQVTPLLQALRQVAQESKAKKLTPKRHPSSQAPSVQQQVQAVPSAQPKSKPVPSVQPVPSAQSKFRPPSQATSFEKAYFERMDGNMKKLEAVGQKSKASTSKRGSSTKVTSLRRPSARLAGKVPSWKI